MSAALGDDEEAFVEVAREAARFQMVLTGMDKSLITEPMVEGAAAGIIDMFNSDWMRQMLSYDPKDDLRGSDRPVLAIFGQLDLQVLVDQNLMPMADALQEAGNPHSQVVLLPKMNHLFQRAIMGLPTEYPMMGKPMEGVAPIVANWLDEVFADAGDDS